MNNFQEHRVIFNMGFGSGPDGDYLNQKSQSETANNALREEAERALASETSTSLAKLNSPENQSLWGRFKGWLNDTFNTSQMIPTAEAGEPNLNTQNSSRQKRVQRAEVDLNTGPSVVEYVPANPESPKLTNREKWGLRNPDEINAYPKASEKPNNPLADFDYVHPAEETEIIPPEEPEKITSEDQFATICEDQNIQNKEFIIDCRISGCYTLKGSNITIKGSPNGVFKGQGGSQKEAPALMLQGENIDVSGVKFETPNNNMALRIAANDVHVSNCEFKDCITGINSTGDGVLIENCDISGYTGDACMIGGSNTTIRECNIHGYEGKYDAKDNHSDAIQVFYPGKGDTEEAKRMQRFGGMGVLKNIKISNNVIDGKPADGEVKKGQRLQGIMCTQVILEDSVITNNTVSVNTLHGITTSLIGESIVSGNKMYSTMAGTDSSKEQAPQINILPTVGVSKYAPEGFRDAPKGAEYKVYINDNTFYDNKGNDAYARYNIKDALNAKYKVLRIGDDSALKVNSKSADNTDSNPQLKPKIAPKKISTMNLSGAMKGKNSLFKFLEQKGLDSVDGKKASYQWADKFFGSQGNVQEVSTSPNINKYKTPNGLDLHITNNSIMLEAPMKGKVFGNFSVLEIQALGKNITTNNLPKIQSFYANTYKLSNGKPKYSNFSISDNKLHFAHIGTDGKVVYETIEVKSDRAILKMMPGRLNTQSPKIVAPIQQTQSSPEKKPPNTSVVNLITKKFPGKTAMQLSSSPDKLIAYLKAQNIKSADLPNELFLNLSGNNKVANDMLVEDLKKALA